MELDLLIKYEFNDYKNLLKICRYLLVYGFVYDDSDSITHEDILERCEKNNGHDIILGFFAPNEKNLLCPDFYVKNDTETNPYRDLLIEILEAIKENKV